MKQTTLVKNGAGSVCVSGDGVDESRRHCRAKTGYTILVMVAALANNVCQAAADWVIAYVLIANTASSPDELHPRKAVCELRMKTTKSCRSLFFHRSPCPIKQYLQPASRPTNLPAIAVLLPLLHNNLDSIEDNDMILSARRVHWLQSYLRNQINFYVSCDLMYAIASRDCQ